MKISAKVTGSQSLFSKLQKLAENSQDNSKVALSEAVLLIHSTAVKSIQKHASVEKIEKRYNPRRFAEVSEPMETPNSDLGKLAQSIEFNIDEDNLTGEVGTNLKYGAYLEFGTQNMAPRPWLYPAVQKNVAKIRDVFEINFKDAITKVTK